MWVWVSGEVGWRDMFSAVIICNYGFFLHFFFLFYFNFNQQQQNPVYLFVIISINAFDIAVIIIFT